MADNDVLDLDCSDSECLNVVDSITEVDSFNKKDISGRTRASVSYLAEKESLSLKRKAPANTHKKSKVARSATATSTRPSAVTKAKTKQSFSVNQLSEIKDKLGIADMMESISNLTGIVQGLVNSYADKPATPSQNTNKIISEVFENDGPTGQNAGYREFIPLESNIETPFNDFDIV